MGVTTLDLKSFEDKIIKNGETALIDFYANWCMPCKMFSPVLEAIAEEYEGTVNCYKVDVDKSGEIAAKYEVMSIPTIILFKDGERTDSFTGSLPKEKVRDFINKHIGE